MLHGLLIRASVPSQRRRQIRAALCILADVHRSRAARISDGEVPGNVAGVQRKATCEPIRTRAVTSEALVCLFARARALVPGPFNAAHCAVRLGARPARRAVAGGGGRAFLQVARRRTVIQTLRASPSGVPHRRNAPRATHEVPALLGGTRFATIVPGRQ